MRPLLSVLWVLPAFVGCASQSVDLLIARCAILDVRSGAVATDQTVVIDQGKIIDILNASAPRPTASRTIAADGRLLVPGFIDVHHHTEYALGDSVTSGGGFVTNLMMVPDSIVAYRQRFADAYLPFGVTSVRDLGSTEEHLPMLLHWMEPSPDAPDFVAVGGALVSEEYGRVPAPSHSVVRDSADAVAKVRALYDLGIRHLKLYWRLREPELTAALAEARDLGMGVTGHIDYNVVPLSAAIDHGLRSFEHAFTIGVGAMTEEEFVQAWQSARRLLHGRQDGLFYVGVMEYFNYLGRDNSDVLRLLDRLATTNSTVTPTLHVFAQRFGLTYFTTRSKGSFDRTDDLTREQHERAVAGYRILADYVKTMHELGIMLTVGTDWTDPGRAVLSEMLLLHDLGIPMADVIRIATLNGATAIGMDGSVGSVEVGKRANLVLLEANVIEDPELLLGEKVVIKDGRIFHPRAASDPRELED